MLLEQGVNLTAVYHDPKRAKEILRDSPSDQLHIYPTEEIWGGDHSADAHYAPLPANSSLSLLVNALHFHGITSFDALLYLSREYPTNHKIYNKLSPVGSDYTNYLKDQLIANASTDIKDIKTIILPIAELEREIIGLVGTLPSLSRKHSGSLPLIHFYPQISNPSDQAQNSYNAVQKELIHRYRMEDDIPNEELLAYFPIPISIDAKNKILSTTHTDVEKIVKLIQKAFLFGEIHRQRN